MAEAAAGGAKVEFHFGELFLRAGFLIPNLEADSRAAVRFYNKRGTAEHWIKRQAGCQDDGLAGDVKLLV